MRHCRVSRQPEHIERDWLILSGIELVSGGERVPGMQLRRRR